MSIDGFAADFLKNESLSGNEQNAGAALAAIDLYRAAGEEKYRDFVFTWLEKTPFETEISDTAQTSVYGKALLFSFDEKNLTCDREAVESLMKLLNQRLSGVELPEKTLPAMPFCMEYEARFDRMERVSEITKRFAAAEKANDPFCLSGSFLTALIDCIECCDERIYEHRRLLIDLFREAIRRVVRDDAADDLRLSSEFAFSVLKGVRLKLLLPDRWLEKGLEMLAEPEQRIHDVKASGAAVPFLRAYSERLLLERR